jgi:ATP-dependent RNA helicase DeaD
MTEPLAAESAHGAPEIPSTEAPAQAPSPVSFRDLTDDPAVLAALDAVGFTKATPVQASSLPLALKGRDLMLQAKTGSGKTLTFVLRWNAWPNP